MSTSAELASGALRYFERVMEREKAITRPSTLQELRLTPDEVRAQTREIEPLSKDEVKRAMARQVKKGSCGRGGLPDYVIQTMYADYLRLGSLAKVGAFYGRTRQSMFAVFSERGLALNAKGFKTKIVHNGRSYTTDKGGYYRDTIYRAGRHKLLHHVLWIESFGPIPAGHQVFFKDGDKTNFALSNLGCMPIREVTLYHHARHLRAARATAA